MISGGADLHRARDLRSEIGSPGVRARARAAGQRRRCTLALTPNPNPNPIPNPRATPKHLLTILTPSTKVADLASWAMLHLWAGAERSREFVAPLLHAKVTLTLV